MLLIFEHIVLILLPGIIMKSGVHSSTIIWTLFFPRRPAFMVILTGFWLRLINDLPLVYLGLQLLWEVAKPDLKLVSGLILKNKFLCQILVEGPCQKNITWKICLRVVRVEESHFVMHLLVPLTSGRRGSMGWCFWCVKSLQLYFHPLCRLENFPSV